MSKSKKVDKPQVVKTDDGSHTLRHHKIPELYHSQYGAIQESMHVFIQEGLQKVDLPKIKILEMGFGTGLNALLTWMHKPEETKIDYIAVDKYPLEDTIWKKLNYPKEVGRGAKMRFEALHKCEWGEPQKLSDDFTIEKREMDFFKYKADRLNDLIYFDAFAPTVQPEMWEAELLNEMLKSLKSGGIMVTYCSKGSFQRHLKACGFKVEKVPGPPGKREMIRAMRR